ncbi:MAG TPA: VOC family protein [Nocardioidaceae bacterium]|jgi:PhnB protein|nr:VOC family protein [Nocardioidaceae bacterium]
MSVVLNPYLSFRDNARAAMEFYQSVFGGELTVSTFAELGGAQDPSEADLVMHAQLSTEHLTLMGSDTPSRMELPERSSISVSLSGDDDATLRGYWDRLCEDGTVSMPLEKAPWGDSFGMCTDRFGTAWLVNISGSAG